MAGSRNELGSEFLLDRRLTKPGCQMCCDETAGFSVCDGWLNGYVGDRKPRRLACSSRRGTLELGTEDTNEQHVKLVLHPLWNHQPVQIISQQP